MTGAELRDAIAAEHGRIQASLVRCGDCGRYFRDIDDHVRNSVTVPAVDSRPDPYGYAGAPHDDRAGRG